MATLMEGTMKNNFYYSRDETIFCSYLIKMEIENVIIKAATYSG